MPTSSKQAGAGPVNRTAAPAAPLTIVLADAGAPFDGALRAERPMGGAEGALCDLAAALAARGHRVSAHTRTDRRIDHAGVAWRPLADGLPESADLYVANRASKLIGAVPRARRRAFWVHNDARHLGKPKFLAPLLRWRPEVVFVGAWHAGTCPWWIPRRRRRVIPLAVQPLFRAEAPRQPPPPRAVFAGNPERGLPWLLELWRTRVQPELPEAELQVYSGALYAGAQDARLAELAQRARAAAGRGVTFHAPVAPAELARAFQSARLLPYPAWPPETFCLTVAEAQAGGLPVVARPYGAMPERIADGATGALADDDASFAEACLRLLRDDALWQSRHRAALARADAWTWDDAAAAFEALARPD